MVILNMRIHVKVEKKRDTDSKHNKTDPIYMEGIYLKIIYECDSLIE